MPRYKISIEFDGARYEIRDIQWLSVFACLARSAVEGIDNLTEEACLVNGMLPESKP